MRITDLFLTAVTVGSEKSGFCANTANIWQIVGYVLMVFRIAIPILLIIFGMIDLGKAVIASKDDEIKKATTGLIKRGIAAVAVFLIPTIVSFLFSVVSGFSNVQNDFEVCKTCITNPGHESKCNVHAKAAWNNENKNNVTDED